METTTLYGVMLGYIGNILCSGVVVGFIERTLEIAYSKLYT